MRSQKIVSASWRTSYEFDYLIEQTTAEARPVTLVNGCFDLFHSGHAKLLQFATAEAARRFGMPGPLVVAINSDTSVARLKGTGHPVLPWAERAAVVAAVGGVHAVVGFDEDTPFDLVAALRPRLLVKGSEYETRPVPEEKALPAGGAVVYVKRDAVAPSSSWVVGRVILSEAVKKQAAAMLRRRQEPYGTPTTGTATDER